MDFIQLVCTKYRHYSNRDSSHNRNNLLLYIRDASKSQSLTPKHNPPILHGYSNYTLLDGHPTVAVKQNFHENFSFRRKLHHNLISKCCRNTLGLNFYGFIACKISKYVPIFVAR